MFGKKKAAEPKQNAAAYIVNQIDTMAGSNNYDMVYGMLCFAYDFQMIDFKERQALGDKLRERASELAEKEKAEKEAAKAERARIIAEHEAQRKEKAKAERAKMNK